MNNKKGVIGIAVIILVLLAFVYGNSQTKSDTDSNQALNNAQVIPAFALPDKSDQLIQIPGEYQGKAFYMLFFSTG